MKKPMKIPKNFGLKITPRKDMIWHNAKLILEGEIRMHQTELRIKKEFLKAVKKKL